MGNGRSFSASGGVTRRDIEFMAPLNSSTMRDWSKGLNEAVGKAWDSAKRQWSKYGLQGNEIDMYVAKLGAGSGIAGFTITGSRNPEEVGRVAINEAFLKLGNEEYDRAVANGHNADRGNKTAVEMIMSHEFAHRMVMSIAKDRSISNEQAAEQIVRQAMRSAGLKGGWKNAAGKISSYATTNHQEAIAESMASYYAHGQNASPFARGVESAIKEMMRMRK